ncbi:armadillo-type protein [Mucor mucedo]|uniref:armadillo-type protein n=1 Tax=Mucor mucedo TaxID=29922 RepID=UPI002220DB66|nr:armadillo-type protein [Mucor mucedo]KAI7896054.1 armadillo-type protein [Mucor mucedo]
MAYEGREDNRGYRPRQEGGGGPNRYRGGGGGGGGPNRYNNRDRKYNNNGGGGNGGGYNQRRPYDRSSNSEPKEDEQEDIEVRLKSLIIKIGDKISSDLQINLAKMKNILDNDYSKYPQTVQDTLKACVTELPAKAPVYGTLLGLLNASSHDIVAKLMVGFNQSLERTINESKWFELKQFLRFYGELVNANVILPSVYCGLLNDLLAALDQPNQLRQRLDCIVYIILATLPWCGKELSQRNHEELDHILKKIEIYMQRRGNVPVLSILKQYNGIKYDAASEDVLAHIWTLTEELKRKNWDLPLIPKPYLWYDNEFTAALQHDLPRFVVPNHTDNVTYIAPNPTMKILIDEGGASLPSIPNHNSIEYFILQETISDTMELFEVNRKDCARYLLGIANSFEPKFFKSPPSSSEDAPEIKEEENSRWNLSDLLVEAAFSQMLRLPTPPVRQVFYSCVFIELCRADVDTFPMALGRGVKALFDRLAYMDVECVHRLWCWFSHHLSNFGFQWDWQAWDSVLTLDPLHPQVCFIRETLEKETRLSYYERIKSIIPVEFQKLIPAIAPGPDFEYKDPNHPLHEKAKIIIESLRTKKSVEEVRALLAQFKKELGVEISEQEQTQIVRQMFVQCLLLVGSKSFSHILNVVERYLDVLRFVNTTPEGRLHTVQIVASFWKNNTQFLGILLDKLLNYRVIDPTSVITWIFEADQLKFVGRSFIWEILKNTLAKVNSRVVQVKGKLDNFQAQYDTNKIKREQSEMTEMAEAEAQQEADALRLVENSLASVSREQKEVFMIVYQKFARVLQELITSNPDVESSWTYKWVFGWYREILRVYYKECGGFMTTLETLVFTPDLDPRINRVFAEVRALKHEFEVLV